jgi:PAS domain S-box-containing protein
MVRILFVDDDEDFLALARKYLNREEPQFIAETVNSAQTALRLFEEKHFDAVVSDYQMPVMDGLEFLAALRQEGNTIPFIFLTGRGCEEVAIRALNLGADYYLMKGSTPRSLFGKLSHILGKVLDHKQMEEALRKSALQEIEEKYRSLLETVPVGISISTPEGEIIDGNKTLMKLAGYNSKESFLKSQAQDLWLNPKDREEFVDELKKGSMTDFEAQLKRSDGTAFWASITATSEIIGSETLYFTITKEITEQKIAEQQLRDSEERLRVLFEYAPDGYYLHDLEGKLVDGNKAAESITGYKREELIGKNILELQLMPEDQLPKAAEGLMLNMEGKPSGPEEFTILRKDGTQCEVEIITYPVTIKGQTLVLGIARDITDRLQAQLALRESEERYRNLVEFSPVPVFVHRQGRFLYLNPAAIKLHGAENSDELLQKSLFDFVYSGYKGVLKERIVQAAKKPQEERYTFLKIKRLDNQVIDLQVAAKEFTYYGEPASLVFCMDISKQKQAEEQLMRQKEELSEFARTLAHDLKNRLLSIEGYADILQTEYEKSYAEKIQTLAEDMNDFVRRSVTLADAGLIIDSTEEVDLTVLVQEVAEAIIPANISFSNDILPAITGDRGKLFQVFLNLFENAVAHGNPSKIEVRCQHAEDAIKILISNDGQPIPLENRLHIFQRKFTTKAGRTEGLGLTIVQKAVEAHGWQIALKDAIETTFCITIPKTN